jgi:hypothetical protein
MEIMVDYLAYYSPVLLRAIEVCDGLINFFSAHKVSENDRFAQAASETKTERNGILERLSSPKYLTLSEFDSSNINGFMAFYDNHATNDYGGSLPIEKLAVRDRLLAAWIAEVVEPLVQLMNQAEEHAR